MNIILTLANQMQLLLTALFTLSLLTNNSHAGNFQDPAAILTAAQELIVSGLPPGTEYEATLAPLDPRLQLNACEFPPEAFMVAPSIKPGRNSIGVRCNGVNNWSLYVSAYVKVYEEVVVIRQPVKRGEILTQNHLQLSRMDISQLRSPYLRDLDNAINKQAMHNLSQDAILSERDLTSAIVVKRGENVMITSAAAGFSIQMQGQALMDGAEGQHIRIKNMASSRIISATVTKPGVVAVDL